MILFPRHELQRSGIDTVALTGGWWAVRKHVSEMRIAARATDLGAAHQPEAVLVLVDGGKPKPGDLMTAKSCRMHP